MVDQKNPQKGNLRDANTQQSQKKEPQGVFGGNVDAFDAIAQQGVQQPNEQSQDVPNVAHSYNNEPIDPFLQSGTEKKEPIERNVDVPDPFLVDEVPTDVVQEDLTEKVSDSESSDVTDQEAIDRQEAAVSVEKKEGASLKDEDEILIVEEEKTSAGLDNLDVATTEKNDEGKTENEDERTVGSPKKRVATIVDEEDEDEEKKEEVIEEGDQKDVDEPTVREEHEAEPTKDQSPLQEKFYVLLSLVKESVDMHKELYDDSFSIVGADNDISFIEYRLEHRENAISIYKNALDKKTNNNEEHALSFSLSADEDMTLQVVVDDALLFDEKDIVDDRSTQIQILDKLSKFLFLVEQQKKILEKSYEEHKKQQSEKETINTFRNF